MSTFRKDLLSNVRTVLAAVTGATLVSLPLRAHLAAPNLVMVYLLGVVIVAARASRGAAVTASFLSVAAFDFFCVRPYYTFLVEELEYLVTFGVMLAVALVISTQTTRIRRQAREAEEREAGTRALYRLADRLASETRVFDTARAAASTAEQVFGTRVIIFLPEDGVLSFRRRTSDLLPLPVSEESTANGVLEHGKRAQTASALYVPLRGGRTVVGVMAVLPDGDRRIDAPPQRHLIDLFASQTALAIERTLSQNAAEASRVQMQTEQMRSSLLSAVSHDLRTPLAAITGAASTLLSQEDKLPTETRHELLESISEEAERLSRLVGNLLDMTRFSSGGVELRRTVCPLEEIAGAALARMEARLAGRQVITTMPEDLPPVFVDDVLAGQVFVNLLENAVKYTPPGTPVEIRATAERGWVAVEVRDHGPGFRSGEEERVFEKFYRGMRPEGRGAGLGLAICRGIVEAHGGTIEAHNHPQGGAVFRFRLPVEEAR